MAQRIYVIAPWLSVFRYMGLHTKAKWNIHFFHRWSPPFQWQIIRIYTRIYPIYGLAELTLGLTSHSSKIVMRTCKVIKSKKHTLSLDCLLVSLTFFPQALLLFLYSSLFLCLRWSFSKNHNRYSSLTWTNWAACTICIIRTHFTRNFSRKSSKVKRWVLKRKWWVGSLSFSLFFPLFVF